ncbi:MAG: condensation domain-containing protein, partial [Ignavibacteriales bacterium]
GLARGYLNRPELTAEKFVPNPFAVIKGERLYKTGDLVRYLEDGTIEFLGRIDNQVKIRGFRIELGEIETALKQHHSIRDAVVLAKGNSNNTKQLAAFLVFKEQDNLSITEIREYLSAILPEYMIPAIFKELDYIPLLPNGKVDNKALLMLNTDALESKGIKDQPRTEIEKTIYNIWSEILGAKQIGINDNFFELGGDSILSIQVVSRANQAGIKITTKQLFQYPTIMGLSRVASRISSMARERQPLKGEVPLTPIQNWFFEQNFKQYNHWNQSLLLEIKQKNSIEKVKFIFSTLINHHDVFRLRYKPDADKDGRWIQYYEENVSEPVIEEISLTDSDEEEVRSGIKEAASKIQQGLNILHGPIIRIGYFHMNGHESDRLLIVIHHLIIDSISWRVLVEEMQVMFEQLSGNERPIIPEVGESFASWSHRLKEMSVSDKIKEDLAYWERLKNRTELQLPKDHNLGENIEGSSDTIAVELDRDYTHGLLHDIHAKYHTKTNEILIAGLFRVIKNWSGLREQLISLESHGREQFIEEIDTSKVTGWFTSLFPVLLEAGQTDDIESSIVSIKEQLRCIPNNGLSYGLLKYSGDEQIFEKMRGIPDPEICFNYLGQFDQLKSDKSIFDIDLGDRGNERGELNNRAFLLDISAFVVNGTLRVNFQYSTNYYKFSTIKKIAEDYVSEIKLIIEHCLNKDTCIYTPSDFTDVKLRQEQIDDIMSEIDEDTDE